MKKILLFIVLAISVISNAQVALGGKTGYNYSFLSPSGEVEHEPRPMHGAFVGGYAEFTLGDIFSLEPNVIYSRQGGLDSKLDYVNIPIHAKVNLKKVSISVAPQIGFIAVKPDDEIKYNDRSFSLVFGASYWFMNRWFVEALYTHPLTNVYQNDQKVFDNHMTDQNNFKNGVISIGIGFLFMPDEQSKLDRLFNTEK